MELPSQDKRDRNERKYKQWNDLKDGSRIYHVEYMVGMSGLQYILKLLMRMKRL